jgi:hypothetical protein
MGKRGLVEQMAELGPIGGVIRIGHLQKAVLHTKGIPVVIPQLIPADFHLPVFQVLPVEKGDPPGGFPGAFRGGFFVFGFTTQQQEYKEGQAAGRMRERLVRHHASKVRYSLKQLIGV